MRSIKRTRRPLAPCIGFYQRGSLPDGGVKCSSCRPARVKSCPTFSLREKKTSPRPFAPFRPLSIFRSKSEFSPSMAYQSRQPLSTLNPDQTKSHDLLGEYHPLTHQSLPFLTDVWGGERAPQRPVHSSRESQLGLLWWVNG